MNILICTSQVPFVSGGAELHVENLRRALLEAGHDADVVSLPFKWYPPREIIRSTLAWRMLDVTEANGKSVDMVIGMKFPAYLVEHPRKVLWIIHQYRSAYDLAGTPYDDLCYYGDGVQTRMFVKNADEKFIPHALKVYANSQNVAARLLRFNNIPSEALYHPPPRAELLLPGARFSGACQHLFQVEETNMSTGCRMGLDDVTVYVDRISISSTRIDHRFKLIVSLTLRRRPIPTTSASSSTSGASTRHSITTDLISKTN